VAAKASGQITAMQVAIRALQKQPGYIHDQFLSDLASYAALVGDNLGQNAERQRAFDDVLEALSTPPGHLPRVWLPPRE
jgi:hypothetical protein